MILLCAALLSLCAGGIAEETPAVHDDSHHTVEREHGQPFAQKTDSMETHTLITSFDLYCEDCGRVIQENVRVIIGEDVAQLSRTKPQVSVSL